MDVGDDDDNTDDDCSIVGGEVIGLVYFDVYRYLDVDIVVSFVSDIKEVVE